MVKLLVVLHTRVLSNNRSNQIRVFNQVYVSVTKFAFRSSKVISHKNATLNLACLVLLAIDLHFEEDRPGAVNGTQSSVLQLRRLAGRLYCK
jgi:hypothetical protein